MKKTFFLSFLFYFFISQSSFAQVYCEHWDPGIKEEMPENVFTNTNTCAQTVDFDNYDLMAPFTIYVNVHFYKGPNGEGLNAAEGVEFANALIEAANEKLNSLEPSNQPGPSGQFPAHVPAAKYNYKLYSDPTNSNDPYGGIWFHPEQTNDASAYTIRVINIHMREDTSFNCGSGWSCTGCDVTIARHLPCLNPTWMADILNHEMGHSLSLDHVTWCDNQCNMVDIDPEQHCQPNCPGLASCDSENPGKVTCDPDLCDIECEAGEQVNRCDWGVSNNIVAQTADSEALTPCQWETVFNRVLSLNTQRYSWADNCMEVAPTLTIPTGSHKIWDGLILLNRDVVIEAGASLTITCEVRMASDRRFTVKRGGKLIVDGGTITSLCEEPWRGIYVWGNSEKEQPDPFGVQELDDAGIVIIKNNSLLEHARHAVVAEAAGIPYAEQLERRGGLVWAENSTFLDNRWAAQFMKYDFTNKSRFFKCHFVENGDYYDGTIGVSMWACNGITFEENTFENMDGFGIMGIDHSIKVFNSNKFINNLNGIESYATQPFSTFTQIGIPGTMPNVFDNNEAHIVAQASDAHDGLKIYGNEFSNAIVGIFIEGPTQYTIEQNSFFNQTLGIVSRQSRDYTNFIDCNALQSVDFGITAEGANRFTQIRGNNFNQSEYNIIVSNNGSIPGEIRQNQGSVNAPALNCFSSNNTEDIITLGATVEFNYFVPPGEIACNAFPTSSGNYITTPTNLTIDVCNDSDETTEEDRPGGGNSTGGRLLSKITEAIQNKDYVTATDLLSEENTSQAKKWLYGVQMLEGDYSEADKTLNALPVETEEDRLFQEVQRINLKFRTSQEEFKLNAQDKAFLLELANGDSYIKGYAQALLILLEGEAFDLKISNRGKIAEKREKLRLYEALELTAFKAFPNPATDKFSITYPTSAEQKLEVRIFDIHGRVVVDQKLDQSGLLNVSTEGFNAGVYIVNILSENTLVFKDKMILIK